MQAQDPVPRHFVTGVVQKPGGADEVLDMGRFEEPEASVLPVRDLPHRQLYLDQVAVMARPHEHGLLAKVHTTLVALQNPVDDRPSFRGCVVATVEGRPCPRAAITVQPEHGLSVGERVAARWPRRGRSAWIGSFARAASWSRPDRNGRGDGGGVGPILGTRRSPGLRRRPR